jgi:outer membrane biosynthesis protein TonB
MSPEHRRLTDALLLSLLVHTWLLSLAFGGQGLWLAGFGFPWQDRRIEVPDLRIVVVPVPATTAEPVVTPVAEPLQQAWVEQPVASGSALTPSVSHAPTARRTAAAIQPEANTTAGAKPGTIVATGAAPAQVPLRADSLDDTALPPIPAPPVIALAPTDEARSFVPATPAMPTPVITAAPSATSPETAMPSLRDAGDAARTRIDQEVWERGMELAKLDPSKQEGQRQAEQLEAARAENARLEAERQDAARQARDLQEAARHVAARQEAALLESARLEAERREAARVEAAKVEAARVEAARVEAARVEAARVEAAKVEAAKVEAAKVEAAKVEVVQEAAARREAALRAIGRQLDEEAARREAAKAAARLPPSSGSARRYWLLGRTDPNAELILYAEAWSRKIQLSGTTFDMAREAAKQPHTDPLVTVAIRSDGSVESVTFVLSSGVAAIDEAIRRIVDSQKPYQAFPPSLAREFDVILIRRTWYFDTAIRLQ